MSREVPGQVQTTERPLAPPVSPPHEAAETGGGHGGTPQQSEETLLCPRQAEQSAHPPPGRGEPRQAEGHRLEEHHSDGVRLWLNQPSFSLSNLVLLLL